MRHPELFFSPKEVEDLDLSCGSRVSHLGRSIQFASEHMTPEANTTMNRWCLLDSVTGVIQACTNAAFMLTKNYNLAKESSVALSTYARYEEQVA